MRLSLAAALFSAALAFAPGASAQGAAPLATIVGSPLPYRIDLPKGWEIVRESEVVEHGKNHVVAGRGGPAAVVLLATDLLEGTPFHGPGAEERRKLTDMLLGSDSAMYEFLNGHGPDAHLSEVVREIRSLGGQRAAYMKAHDESEDEPHWFEMHVTVRTESCTCS